jgi:hypothetical protein
MGVRIEGQLDATAENHDFQLACGRGMPQELRDAAAVYLINILSGKTLLQDFEPTSTEKRVVEAAERSRERIAAFGPGPGPYQQIRALTVMVGSLLAISLWYQQRFNECLLVASHIIDSSSYTGGAEACRVRGFAHFALGDYAAAKTDLLQAQRREARLVGLKEPLKALEKLTNGP